MWLRGLDAGIIYPISNSKWVGPTPVLKKSGVTIMKNEDELLPTCTALGERVCINYRRLNTFIRKDHFPLSFTDQILERLVDQSFFCFLDGYLGYNQVSIFPDDQEKTFFTYPHGSFAFRCIPFRLCNAPAIFQRCIVSIFFYGK